MKVGVFYVWLFPIKALVYSGSKNILINYIYSNLILIFIKHLPPLPFIYNF
jgi:hypothetical protein